MTYETYYYIMSIDSSIHRLIAVPPLTYISNKSIRSRLIKIGEGNLEVPITLRMLLPDDITEFFFPSGEVWLRATNTFLVENGVRYRHLAALYKQQEAISSN
mgnify:CR=1 FL=1